MIDLPTKAGAVIRWGHRYDGVVQYQVAVLSLHYNYAQGLAWHRTGWSEPWSHEKMQETVSGSHGEWEILHGGEH